MAISPAVRLGVVVLSTALFSVLAASALAQSNKPLTDSPLMRQFHQALSLAQHGDRQQAMNLVLRLVEQHPDFAPAIKLKGMLLEESGRTSEAAGAYEQALKLAPNDADLLLKVGIYKLTAGQKEEA